MFIFSAAMRTVRSACSHLRPGHRGPSPEATAAGRRVGGGPFLHWVPDRPEGSRLAGEYLPVWVVHPEQPAVTRWTRRRR